MTPQQSTAVPLSGLRLAHGHETDLRWFFHRDYEGDLGKRSPLGFQLEHARYGVTIQRTQRLEHDLDERLFNAATRARRISHRLAQLDAEHLAVLASAFGPMRPVDLSAFGPHAALAPLTRAARVAHRRSGTNRPLLDWLERLSLRLSKSKNPTRIFDAELKREILRDAENMLVAASRAYRDAARERPPK